MTYKLAPWFSEDDLAESRLRNPPHRYKRLWQGIWSAGDGDGLDPADIDACQTLERMPGVRRDRIYIAALNLGVKHDHSALCVLAANLVVGVVELASVQSWRPEDFGGAVDLEVVKFAVKAAHQRYGFCSCLFDPWQAMHIAQELAKDGVPMREWAFTPANKDTMARALLEAFRNRLVAIYPDPQFTRDLLRLRIKEGPLGFRLDAIRDADGHADRAIAFSIALPVALYAAREHRPEPVPEILFA